MKALEPSAIPQESEDTEQQVEAVWMQAIAREWHDELADPREDIYTLEDGEPLDAPRTQDAASAA